MRSSFKNQTIFSLAALTLVLGLAGAVAPAAAHDIGGMKRGGFAHSGFAHNDMRRAGVVRVTKGGPGNRIVAECLFSTNSFDGYFNSVQVSNNCHNGGELIAR